MSVGRHARGTVGVRLCLEAEDLDVRLARGLAIVLVAGDDRTPNLLAHVAPGVALLGGACLNRDGVAAHVRGGVDSRASDFDHPGFSCLVIGDEVDAAVLTRLSGAPARDAE